MSRKLYHYCSIDAFESIIKSKSLWLSDATGSNDEDEIIWSQKIVKKALTQLFEENDIKLNLEEDYWYSDNEKNHLEYIIKEMQGYLFGKCFISCLSTYGDMKDQWNEYGNHGKGLSIGFNLSRLETVGNRNSKVRLARVFYDEAEQIEEILFHAERALNHSQDVFEYYKEKLKMFLKENINGWLQNELETFAEPFAESMIYASAILKNPSFETESEWRIYYIRLKDKEDVKNKKNNIIRSFNKFDLKKGSKKYSKWTDEEVEYIILSFERLIELDIIEEIIIGKECGLSEEYIKELLNRNGYNPNIKVNKSQCSYKFTQS